MESAGQTHHIRVRDKWHSDQRYMPLSSDWNAQTHMSEDVYAGPYASYLIKSCCYPLDIRWVHSAGTKTCTCAKLRGTEMWTLEVIYEQQCWDIL